MVTVPEIHSTALIIYCKLWPRVNDCLEILWNSFVLFELMWDGRGTVWSYINQSQSTSAGKTLENYWSKTNWKIICVLFETCCVSTSQTSRCIMLLFNQIWLTAYSILHKYVCNQAKTENRGKHFISKWILSRNAVHRRGFYLYWYLTRSLFKYIISMTKETWLSLDCIIYCIICI